MATESADVMQNCWLTKPPDHGSTVLRAYQYCVQLRLGSQPEAVPFCASPVPTASHCSNSTTMSTSVHQAGCRHTPSLFLEKGMEQQARLPCGERVSRLILSLNEMKLKCLVGKNINDVSKWGSNWESVSLLKPDSLNRRQDESLATTWCRTEQASSIFLPVLA